MAKRVPSLRLKSIYENTAEIMGKASGRNTWSDEEIISNAGIELVVLDDEEMIEECKVFIYGMHHKMTPRSIASALLLTWNMRSVKPLERRIFPEIDPGMDINDTKVCDFEEPGESYTSSDMDTLFDNISPFEIRRACSFLAASTLKMFAKSVDSWIKAWDSDHFNKSYLSFTNKDFPLSSLVVPQKAELDIMYDAYQGHSLYLWTLGRILYCLAEVEDNRQTEMLFERHLSFTGMHIVPLFMNAKIALGAPTPALLSALDMGQNEPTLVQLRDLINFSLSKPIDQTNRGTWRYSRLFDPNAFTMLQTKYVADTVAILAHLNTISSSDTNKSNPLGIAVLRQMGAMRMRNAKIVAHNIYHYFTSKQSSSSPAPFTK